MFRASPDSSQIDLFSNIEQFLRGRDQEKLNDPNAWHNVFLDQVVKRVSEERFAELFDEATGRPNAPLRVLVGMLILKEGFGWSDEELFWARRTQLLRGHASTGRPFGSDAFVEFLERRLAPSLKRKKPGPFLRMSVMVDDFSLVSNLATQPPLPGAAGRLRPKARRRAQNCRTRMLRIWIR